MTMAGKPVNLAHPAAFGQRAHAAGQSQGTQVQRGIDTPKFARFILYAIGLYSSLVQPLAERGISGNANEDGTNWVTQAVWVSFAASTIALVAIDPMRLAIRPVLRSHAFLLALMGWFTLSALWSLSPDATIRRIGLQIIILVAVAICVVLVREARTVVNDILQVLFITAVANWLALVLLPPTPLGHAGIYLSKNNFGTFAALMALLGVSRIATGPRWMRLMAAFVVLSGFVFLAVSAAKTSIGLAVLVPAMAIFVLRFPLNRTTYAVPAALAGIMILIVVVGIMATFSLTTDDLFTFAFGDPTFTGRTAIWSFVWSYIENRPWLGYGFGGFWSTGTSSPVMQAGLWWMKDLINQSHDLYVDLLLQGGCVALILFFAHIGALVAHSRGVANWHWSDKMSVAAIIFYSLIYNLMDTTLFRSFNSVWIYFLTASLLVGLGPLAADAASDRGGPPDRGKPARARPRAGVGTRPPAAATALRAVTR
jgi:exopolysaccharide production protein ExoQ